MVVRWTQTTWPLFQLGVEQRAVDEQTVFIVLVSEMALAHAPYITDVTQTCPFSIELADFSALKGRLYFWIVGDTQWPKGTKSSGYFEESLALSPQRKCKDVVQDALLSGWSCDGQKLEGSLLLSKKLITAEGKICGLSMQGSSRECSGWTLMRLTRSPKPQISHWKPERLGERTCWLQQSQLRWLSSYLTLHS